MGFTNADLLAIKAELTNNPLTLSGYLAVTSANDEANANALNLIRAECQVDRESIPMSEIGKCLKMTEVAALSQGQRDWINMVAASGEVNPKTGGEVRTGYLALFGSASATRANLLAILTEDASRITQLFKAGTLSQGGQVTPSDVANARAAT